MLTSYKKVFDFKNAATQVLSFEKTETKLKSALEDVLDQVDEIEVKFNKHALRLRRAHAAEDLKNGCILREPNGNYSYTKAGETALEDELETLIETQRDLDLDPVLVEIPANFPTKLTKYFRGFVFREVLNPAKQLISDVKKATKNN